MSAAGAALETARQEVDGWLAILDAFGELVAVIEDVGFDCKLTVGGTRIDLRIGLGGPLALPMPEPAPEPEPAPGARVVRASKPEQGGALKEGVIKKLTGGEPILARDRRRGRWTQSEIEQLDAMIRADKPLREVRQRFPGRTPKAVDLRYYRTKRQLRDCGDKTTAPVPRGSAPAFDDSGRPGPDRAIEAHLNALGHVAPWDAALDAEMFELLTGGTKAAEAAGILEIHRDDVIARFRVLVIDDTIDTQARTLRILKARAGQGGLG